VSSDLARRVTLGASLAATVLLLVGAPGRAQAPQTPGAAPAAATHDQAGSRAAYVLGPDDEILVRAVDMPEFSDKPQRVDPGGDIRLPSVGRIHAAGLTQEELETVIRDRLKTYLREPDVTVTVVQALSQTVSVLGAVAQPGVRPLDRNRTLIELLSAAGGPSLDAGPVVRITRKLDQGPIPLPEAANHPETGYSIAEVPLKALMNATTPEKNILIRPDDIVSIPRAEVVYVVGEVGKAGAVPLLAGKSMSVVEALSASGGALRTAAPKAARILRVAAGAEMRTEIPVDLSKVMQGLSSDVPLYAGDILVVPNSPGKRAATVAIEAAIQAGVMISTYGILH
jgi:polysaccharide export outer membrane protein